jgi:hypothetical protein
MGKIVGHPTALPTVEAKVKTFFKLIDGNFFLGQR